MTYSIAVIGGGWYGCHIASSMKALGFEVQLFEKHDRLLHEASGNNQFRLHLGFHYPRHSGTRIQSRDGYAKFLERYGSLSQPVDENIYAVPIGTSLIDFDTYKLIMTASGIPYQTVEGCDVELTDIEGMMRTSERVLLIAKARQYFQEHLGDSLRLSTQVDKFVASDSSLEINGQTFDYAVDATWGHFSPLNIETFYEPTILLYFEAASNLPAITFVDGPLYSIYPTEEKSIYTLSSVPHTPLGRYERAGEAEAARDRVDSATVDAKLALMTAQARQNVPSFSDTYKFMGPQLAIKTKPVGNSDDRSCYVSRSGRLFTVMSGKIDTIFFATERILSMLEADQDTRAMEVPSSLLSDIRATAERVGEN